MAETRVPQRVAARRRPQWDARRSTAASGKSNRKPRRPCRVAAPGIRLPEPAGKVWACMAGAKSRAAPPRPTSIQQWRASAAARRRATGFRPTIQKGEKVMIRQASPLGTHSSANTRRRCRCPAPARRSGRRRAVPARGAAFRRAGRSPPASASRKSRSGRTPAQGGKRLQRHADAQVGGSPEKADGNERQIGAEMLVASQSTERITPPRRARFRLMAPGKRE